MLVPIQRTDSQQPTHLLPGTHTGHKWCCIAYTCKGHSQGNEAILDTIERASFVNNCLHSTTYANKAGNLIDQMCELLSAGGFEIRQWASNVSLVVEHLFMEARAASTELWLSQHGQDPEEPALCLSWNCFMDRLGYRHHPWSTPSQH